MKTKCYSVRLESLVSISDRAYKARSFDGTEAIIPKSQVLGQDYDVQKSEAFWISSWILEKKSLQFSKKKEVWFDESGNMLPTYKIEKHHPEKIENINIEPIKDLLK
jgi:hypothetical protein